MFNFNMLSTCLRVHAWKGRLEGREACDGSWHAQCWDREVRRQNVVEKERKTSSASLSLSLHTWTHCVWLHSPYSTAPFVHLMERSAATYMLDLLLTAMEHRAEGYYEAKHWFVRRLWRGACIHRLLTGFNVADMARLAQARPPT